MGYERSLIPRLGALFDAAPDFPASQELPRAPGLVWDIEGVKQASRNHVAMALNGELLRSSAYGTPGEYHLSRAPVLQYLDLELKEVGLWQSEMFTGAPHGGMHMAAMFAGRMAAFRKQDTELLKLQDEHFRRLYTYLAATATPSGDIVCVGDRMPKGPAAPQQAAVWRESHLLPHPEAKKLARQIDTDFYVSLRGLRKLVAAGDKLGGALRLSSDEVSSMPLTARRVEVCRRKDGHSARYVDPARKGTTAWVDVTYRDGSVEWGLDSPEKHGPRGSARILQTERRRAA